MFRRGAAMLSAVFRSTYLVLSTPVVGHPLPISWSGNLSNGFGINTTIIFFFHVHVKDSAIAASCDEPLAAGRVGRTPRGGSTHLVTAATVTTGAKPHGQLQLARNLEVERAVTGQRCRPQSFGEVQPCYPLFFVPHTWYSVLL